MKNFPQNNSKITRTKGSLKIFLGMATGVGKTHKMLQSAISEYENEKNCMQSYDFSIMFYDCYFWCIGSFL